MYGIKSVYVHLMCSMYTPLRLYCEMHRNFSLYSSLALLPLFCVPLSFIFNASDSPSLSMRVCVCVYARCHAEILKFAFADSFPPFSFLHPLYCAWMGKKRASMHKKEPRMVKKNR